MWNQAAAILWAQWRSIVNLPRAGNLVNAAVTVLWYGAWTLAAIATGIHLSGPENIESVETAMPGALLLVFLYWQGIPVLLAATGASLEMKKVMIYPIPHSQLFGVEVLLRVSTGIEMFLLVVGSGLGLLANPKVPWWGPASFGPFILINLFLSAGLRDILVRLLSRKRIREVAVVLMVLAAAAPQILARSGFESQVRAAFVYIASPHAVIFPWAAVGSISMGHWSWTGVIALLGWTLIAYAFGRWQFERSLMFDAAEARSEETGNALTDQWGEFFFRLPGRFLSDPLAVLVEKDIRFLSRAPRFRIVFIMGFSFGLLVWLPLAFGQSGTPKPGIVASYLTLICIYALLLMGDVAFWNVFGFDRSATQIYYLMPLKMSTVLIGKNIVALVFVILEISAITGVCLLLRMPLQFDRLLEAYMVTLVIGLYLMAVGNASSLSNPRPVNPSRAMRTSTAGQTQALMLVIYPFIMLPAMMAFLARYAFRSNTAFYVTLAFSASLGALLYWVSLESAVEAAEQQKERLLTVLSKGEGPISS